MVEEVDQQDRADGDGLGGCHRVRVGGGLFREPVFLPELRDSFVFTGEIVAGGRLPVCEQDELWGPYSADPVAHAADAAYVAGVQLQVVSGMAEMGLQAGVWSGESGTERYRSVQFSRQAIRWLPAIRQRISTA